MGNDVRLPGSVVSLTGEAADRLLKEGDGDAALLYLALLRTGRAGVAGWNAGRVRAASDTLIRLGLLEGQPEAPAPTPQEQLYAPENAPAYSTADITQELERSRDFRGLTDEIERKIGRKLSPADLRSLYTIYDYLELPPEVILLVTNYAMEQIREKYGPGRRASMQTIKKAAFRWKQLGIDTPEAAEKYLRAQSALGAREREILPLLGITDRPLVDRERSYLESWIRTGFADDAIRLAYEKTLMRKNRLDWAYMNGILKSWSERGLLTAKAVEERDRAPARGRGKTAGRTRTTGPAPDSLHPADPDTIRQDMERTKRALENLKKQEGESGNGV